MNDPLTTQIRDLFAQVDEEQGAVDIATVTAPGLAQELQPAAPPPPSGRGWVAGLAAAAAVAALVVVPLLFIALGDDPNVATSVPETIVPPTTLPSTTAPEAATTVPPTTVPQTSTTLPAFPLIKESLTHGGEAWGVYLFGGAWDDPALLEAAQLLQDLGFRSGAGDMSCDHGGADLLGFDAKGDWAAVGMYFESEADAEAFVVAMEARGHEVVGWGLVLTGCMDWPAPIRPRSRPSDSGGSSI